MVSKKHIAVILSKLKTFQDPSLEDEQYSTDSEVASDILWNAYLRNELSEKTIADLGAGTGILGLGCLILGAKKVFFVEKDEKAIDILKENIAFLEDRIDMDIKKNCEIINKELSGFEKKVDVVIQNPPFGTKNKHADKLFLEKAFQIADIVYSLHKTSTSIFVKAISQDFDFEIKDQQELSFPLKKTQEFHKKKIQRIEVTCFYMVKQNEQKT